MDETMAKIIDRIWGWDTEDIVFTFTDKFDPHDPYNPDYKAADFPGLMDAIREAMEKYFKEHPEQLKKQYG